MSKRSLTFLVVCAGALLAFASGCSKRETTPAASGPDGAPPKKILHFGNGSEPQDLDPQILTGVPEHHLMNALFEGLVSPDPEDKGVPQPGVAERWEISPDGLVYTFHLRADAHWTDGQPVTAQDFVASYRRMLTPSLGADYAYMLFHLDGAEDFYRGLITDFAQTGCKALDDHTLQLKLRQPAPFLLNAMQHYAWFPVPVHVVEKFGGLDRKGTDWTRLENFVGNGPFRLKAWRPNQHLIAERSPTYWDRARVKLDEIHFYPIELAETEERMFRTGQLHVTNEVPLTKIAVYRRDLPEALKLEPWCGVYFYR
ncbi:MAG TPA: peptide ABC transporter substrate-binding protein, partial [Opitutaceae bacterium]